MGKLHLIQGVSYILPCWSVVVISEPIIQNFYKALVRGQFRIAIKDIFGDPNSEAILVPQRCDRLKFDQQTV